MTKELLERDLQNLFYNLVRKGGGMCEKMAPTRWGIPDCLVLYPGGRIFLVELKTEKGQLRAAQSLWHEKASQRGTHVVVLHGERAARAWCSLQATMTEVGRLRALTTVDDALPEMMGGG